MKFFTYYAQIELKSYTEYDEDGIPNIIIKT
jgi:hypothetical protein